MKKARAAALLEALPGLMTFDLEPLRIPLPAPLREAQVAATGMSRVALVKVALEGVPRPPEGSYAVTASHVTNMAGDPLRGREVATGWVRDPWVRLRFAEPAAAAALLLHSRPGRRGTRAVRITLDCAGTEPFDVATDDPAWLAGRVAALRAAAEDLVLALAEELPGHPAPAQALLAATRLFRGIGAALAGGPLDAAALRDLRWEAMAALLAALRALPPEARRARLPAAAALLRALMGRDVTEVPDPPELALGALAFAVLDDFLPAAARVPVERLRACGGIPPDAAAVAAFEQAVNAEFPALGGRPEQMPLMLRVHGLSGPFLAPNAPMVLAVMGEVQAALDSLGHRSALCYGTLLGAVREGDFIAHDDDVDLAVELPAADGAAGMAAVVEGLQGLGFHARLDPRLFAQVRPPGRRFAVDLFPIIPLDDGQVAMLMEGMRIRPVRRELVLPLGRIAFRGMEFGAPARPEDFLADRYGPGWRVPQRKVGHQMVGG
ncbi:LicD family protein [Roseococcus sp. DSY-14]|uniref:LicD family protein n=1 Tax=Roseococcus sp. DSY-14 TaxID=3369650 RepID=UPI00387B6877